MNGPITCELVSMVNYKKKMIEKEENYFKNEIQTKAEFGDFSFQARPIYTLGTIDCVVKF
jgi:hypothetical protein